MRRLVSSSQPLAMGHEASGTIHAIRPAVMTLRPGDSVALEPGLPCRLCKGGQYNPCPRKKFAAAPPDNHGTLTKYFKLPADFCYSIPDGTLPLDEAVLLEPLAVAVHSVRKVGVKPGDGVVVLGAGSMGLLCAAAARMWGAERIVSVDVNEEKLRFARRLFATSTSASASASASPAQGFSSRSNSSSEAGRDAAASCIHGIFVPRHDISAEANVQDLLRAHASGAEDAATDVPGFDVAIEATGAEPCIQMAIHVLWAVGSFIQTSKGTQNVNFPISAIAVKEIVVMGCFRYGPGDFQLAM